MQSTERQRFEESWKSAFDGAEMTPSENVWNSIELGLAGEESARMKKRVVFYQRVAAATVGIALLTGLYAFYLSNDTKPQLATTSTVAPKPSATTPSVETNKAGEQSVGSTATNSRPTEVESVGLDRVTATSQPTDPSSFGKYQLKNIAGIPVTTLPNLNYGLPGSMSRDSSQLSQERSVAVVEKPVSTAEEVTPTEPLQTDAGVVTASLLPESTEVTKKSQSSERYWLALGGAAGNFAPNSAAQMSGAFQGAGFNMAAAADQKSSPSPRSNSAKVGYAYSVGMAAGKKFGRVVVQAGLNLVKQEVEYTSNYASLSAVSNKASASVAEYATPQSSYVQLTNEYTVASSMDLVSIPIQAGYLIIDRKLGWQLNGGISSDFFIRNTLVDKSGLRESYSQGAGADSPYRSVNWSGLLNTEVSYRLGTNFRLSLVPGVRYSFQTLLKDPANSGRPVILDVGFRVRYLMK